MLYDFSHAMTLDGRRVSITVDALDYDRAAAHVAARYFADAIRQPVDGGMVRVTLTVPAAVRIRDALAIVGGGAAIAGRMLGDHLDEMVAEIGRARGLALPLPATATLEVAAA